MKKNFFIAFLVFAFFSCFKSKAPNPDTPEPPAGNTFINPLLASGPDPWVIKKDTFYYYTQTQGNKISIWKTSAMSKLNFANPVTIWTKPIGGPNSENVWAPELHFLDGKWYMYYTAGSTDANTTQRIFVLENASTDPVQGTWVDKGEIRDLAADFWAIDPNVFEYNKNRYILWSGHSSLVDMTQKIFIARLQNPWTLATGRTEISAPIYDWETHGAPPAVNEGPEVLQDPKGKPILIFSASGCWTDDYNLGMCGLKDGGDPLNAGDWVKAPNPVFVKEPDNSAFGPGHCAFFKSRDGKEDWLIYHANALPNQGCSDFRNPRMQKFTWNVDGTPNFGKPLKINTPIVKPSGE